MELSQAAALAQRLRAAVADERVLAAVASIPRDRFVPAAERHRAYENVALPIACGQTISQPLVVARMLEALAVQPVDRVLDIGTGSGYHAALLALLANHVWTIERHPALSAEAERSIRGLGIDNVSFLVADGTEGLPALAPFDVINVAAATGDEVAGALERQLAPGGRMVVPVGNHRQHLVLTRRTPEGFARERLEAVRFVPLVRGEPEGDGEGGAGKGDPGR
ncbi:MAG: protein-L-isoaspartate(D-aspartate) O-methyltransferase [Solirubrobacterales bacterium]|nr:protein-L-isoaspartate(D-aspartate) O-methyltransferase [Solirubrobacterales bacterium]MBV9716549.1 protein-L-isoaspartate(D-aspartate) O-methyltransferase [Solirubrobacterales bacterium]